MITNAELLASDLTGKSSKTAVLSMLNDNGLKPTRATLQNAANQINATPKFFPNFAFIYLI